MMAVLIGLTRCGGRRTGSEEGRGKTREEIIREHRREDGRWERTSENEREGMRDQEKNWTS
eukprot:767107-Hanusia_phi.AAC.1